MKPTSQSVVEGSLSRRATILKASLSWKQAPSSSSQLYFPKTLHILCAQFEHWVDLNCMIVRLPCSHGRKQVALITFIKANGIVNNLHSSISNLYNNKSLYFYSLLPFYKECYYCYKHPSTKRSNPYLSSYSCGIIPNYCQDFISFVMLHRFDMTTQKKKRLL